MSDTDDSQTARADAAADAARAERWRNIRVYLEEKLADVLRASPPDLERLDVLVKELEAVDRAIRALGGA